MNHLINEAEVVTFFKDHKIVKTLIFSDFSKMMDEQTLFPGFAGRSVKAAYVRFDSSFVINIAVLFCIDFDMRGRVKSGWNLPLRHLADTAGDGPDLGDGRMIRLSCASQCSVNWHQRELWDMDTDYLSADNELQVIRKNIKDNPLGVEFSAPIEDSSELAGVFEFAADNPEQPLQNLASKDVNGVVKDKEQDLRHSKERDQLLKAMKMVKQQQQKLLQREQQIKTVLLQMKAMKTKHAQELRAHTQLIDKLKSQLQYQQSSEKIAISELNKESTKETVLS